MNTMVKRLILKDWYFQRWLIGGYFAGGVVSLAFLGMGGSWSFYAGTVLLMTVLIAMGAQVVIGTVVRERSQQTLPFIMTLPVSTWEYTTAKILANVTIFLVPWTALVAGTIGVLAGSPRVPIGMIPFAVIVLTELFASYCLTLAVAIVTESEGWTIGAIVFGNLFLQGFLYFVARIRSIAGPMGGPHLVWSRDASFLFVGEIGVILLLLGITFYVQSRKTDFL